MAIITLKFTDTDVASGNWRFDLDANGSEIDDGMATAAYFTGFYLQSILNTPDFIVGCGEFGATVVSALQKQKPDMVMATLPATATVTLEDKDLNTGRFASTLEMDGPQMETALPTMAQVIGAYVRALVTDQDFAQRVWDFAEAYVAGNAEAEITNNGSRPVHGEGGSIGQATGAGSLAA